MPRSKPLSKREQEICARLISLRKLIGFSREEFSTLGGDTIKRVELARVPLRWDVAGRIWLRAPNINPLFLASNEGPPLLEFDILLPHPHEVSSKPDVLFSEVVDKYSKAIRTWFGTESEAQMPVTWIQAQKDLTIQKREDADRAMALLQEQKARVERWEANAKSSLQLVTACGNDDSVKAKLPTLLARLNKATGARGAKSALAKYMGVPLPNVSQWLSGEREPSGETTLQLLNWVEQQEQKK
jgi:hypothetical protein